LRFADPLTFALRQDIVLHWFLADRKPLVYFQF